MNMKYTKLGRRYRKWKKWINRYDIGSPLYKVFVLLGIEFSPTFKRTTLPEDEDWWY